MFVPYFQTHLSRLRVEVPPARGTCLIHVCASDHGTLASQTHRQVALEGRYMELHLNSMKVKFTLCCVLRSTLFRENSRGCVNQDQNIGFFVIHVFLAGVNDLSPLLPFPTKQHSGLVW